MSQQSRREFLTCAGGLAAGAGTPAAQNGRRPNILFLFPDQLRFDWIGGDPKIPVRTPNVDALAARGVRFNKAIVASPLCAPSRACLASGKEYERCRVASNGEDYPLEQTTFYSLLRGSGYHVAGCGKLDLHKATLDWGVDGKRLLPEWGFSDGIDNAGKFDAVRSGGQGPKDPYMGYLHRRGLAAAHVQDFLRRARLGYQDTSATPLPEEAYCDNWVSANGLELLKRAPTSRPWFLVVNFTGPHNPMDITRRMETLCRDRRYPQPNRCLQYTPEIHVAIRQNYSAMVENIDRWLGVYVNELKKRGELENTLIVFSSDHGEMLGDQNRWGKSVPYQPSVGVPLVAAGPGVRRGVVSEALVSIMDLAATYLDYAGLATPADMDSRSLRPLLEGKAAKHREFLLSGLGSWRTVWDGRYKLIQGFDPKAAKKTQARVAPALLFDLEGDLLENVNLAAKEPGHLKRLARFLAA